MRHKKRRIYRNAKGTHLYSRWAYKRGGDSYPVGLISVIIYSLVNEWAYNGGGGGGFKVEFYGI